MELLFEILGEIFFEGIFEIIKNKNISKWIRYPLFIFINALYLVILGIFLIISIKLFIKKGTVLCRSYFTRSCSNRFLSLDTKKYFRKCLR